MVNGFTHKCLLREHLTFWRFLSFFFIFRKSIKEYIFTIAFFNLAIKNIQAEVLPDLTHFPYSGHNGQGLNFWHPLLEMLL